MKIAVSTEGTVVAPHFGHCKDYTIATTSDGAIVDIQVIPNPGHEPNFLPGYLADRGVSIVIAGGMGARAQGLFAERGIATVVGASGNVESVIRSYLDGTLTTGDTRCDHGREGRDHHEHHEHHECRHHRA